MKAALEIEKVVKENMRMIKTKIDSYQADL